MKFLEGKIYLDRENKKYRYVTSVGGVTKFEDLQTGKMIVNHQSGRYRWDDIDNNRDIIVEGSDE